MKSLTIIFALAFLAQFSQAQNIGYTIEAYGPDSIFLIETASQSFVGSPRPQEVITPLFFRDTSQLTEYAKRLDAEALEVETQLANLKIRSEFISQRAKAVNGLRRGGTWPIAPKITRSVPGGNHEKL